MKIIDRSDLSTMLLDWQAGRRTGVEVLEQAETLWEEGAPWPEYPREDSRSIDQAVLQLLAALVAQLVTPEDIPALLTFLRTEPGKELEGWREMDRYWNTVDFATRSASFSDVLKYYAPSASRPTSAADSGSTQSVG